MIFLGQPSRAQPEDSLVPSLVPQHQHGRKRACRFDLRLGALQQLLLERLPVAVEPLQLEHERARHLFIRGVEELDGRVGRGDASRRIDPGTDAESDVARAERPAQHPAIPAMVATTAMVGVASCRQAR